MLEINLTAVLTQAIAFILLVVGLGKFVLPMVDREISGRQRDIQSTLEQIAADRQAMEASRAEYEKRLAGIEAEAREKIAGAVKQAHEEAAAIMTAAKNEAGEQRERALADIDQERKKTVAQIRGQMADLAVIAASKVLEREITPAVHRELIRDFVNDVSARA
jgi:F-type H+-transporting ATPase subunit b